MKIDCIRTIGVALLIVMLTCILLASCGGSSKVNKSSHSESAKSDSSGSTTEKATEVKTEEGKKTTDAEFTFLQQQTEEQGKLISQQQQLISAAKAGTIECMSALDSLDKLVKKYESTPCNEGGKVVKKSNGDIEITGLKALNAKLIEELKKKDSTNAEKTTSTTKTTETKTADSSKQKESEFKFMSLWWLIVMLITGYVLGNKFPFGQIISIFYKPKKTSV